VPSRPAAGVISLGEVVVMSLMDKAKSLLSGNKNTAKGAVDKGGDVVDEKTGGKYEGKVDTAQQKADDYIDRSDQ
jgi:hypothetical protein